MLLETFCYWYWIDTTVVISCKLETICRATCVFSIYGISIIQQWENLYYSSSFTHIWYFLYEIVCIRTCIWFFQTLLCLHNKVNWGEVYDSVAPLLFLTYIMRCCTFFPPKCLPFRHQKSLYNAWVTTAKLWHSVKTKRAELQMLRSNLKLHSILKGQVRSYLHFFFFHVCVSCGASCLVCWLNLSNSW